MLRHVVLISLAAACGSCMEMRETVERMVMVRTTGSDLQPAATGYIYKKENDGEESVVQMGESEIMEKLSKLYEQPKYSASSASASYEKVADPSKADTNSQERIIPVKEEEEDNLDGIADVDYKKIFDDYTPKYGHSSAYDDYLKHLKHYKGGLYHKYDGDSSEDDKGYKDIHRHANDDAGTYHNKKYESFSASGGHEKGHNENDAHKKSYDHAGSNGQNAAQNNDDDQRFQKVYDNSDNKKHHEYYGKGLKAYADGHKYYGSDDGGHKHDDSHESKHHNDKLGHRGNQRERSEEHRGASHSSEGHEVSHERHGDVGSPGGSSEGQSYGFKIKH